MDPLLLAGPLVIAAWVAAAILISGWTGHT